MKTTDMPSCTCPHCQVPLDKATDPRNENVPAENDVTICVACGSVLMFNADLTVRELTDTEYEALPTELLWEISQFKSALHLAKLMKARS